LRIGNVAIPVPPDVCSLAAPGATSSSPPFPLTLQLSLRQPGHKPRTLSASPTFRCRRDRTGAVRSLTVVPPRQPKLGASLTISTHGRRHLRIGQVSRLTATVSNRTPHTAYDVSVRSALPRGLRVLHHSGVTVRAGLASGRLGTLPRHHSRTIRLLIDPTAAGRHCTTVTAQATLRKLASTRVCIDVRRAPRPSGGRG
jgi:uncharacterized repeat protein (TIGR01451 family)